MEQMISPKQCAARPRTRPPGHSARRASFKIASILVPLDFSRRSLKALKYAIRAESGRGTIDEIVSSLRSQEIIIQGVVALGAPAQNICDYARAHDVDLIIASTHGSSGLVHLLLGSTAEHVVRHSHCPVRVMPGQARRGKRE